MSKKIDYSKEDGLFRLRKDLVRQLYELKEYGETYSDVVRKILKVYHRHLEEEDEELVVEEEEDEEE
jgi:hypothetical protein